MTLDAKGHELRRRLIREGVDPHEAFEQALAAQVAGFRTIGQAAQSVLEKTEQKTRLGHDKDTPE